MKLEIPVLKSCCFCLPLRHSLVAWGCFKMAADAVLITALSISLTQVVVRGHMLDPNETILSFFASELVVPTFAMAVLIVDLVVTATFVFGGLKKNVKLTQVFYFISIAMWIFSLLVTATFVVIAILSSPTELVSGLPFYFLTLGVQTYFLILLRSEIIILKNDGESSSQNNAAEVESTKKCEEIVAGEEAEKEVV